ncbi:hypothetical protein [Streptomyces sp. FL07-04A]|uniref:hypothetical protein n=1 Tax=Streptomyces sp. FL07-04A TaxID=3028658 RepID=UPI0029B1787F|nr:hypothetical protein [Streptomyces sp. FL07-04A]MDX3575985.1 hypothetical protein [Streptomyces sp. FL07-04A]
MTHTVRTTMRPDQSVEVDDLEYSALQRQGLLVSEASPEAPAAAAAPVPMKKTSGATGSKEN